MIERNLGVARSENGSVWNRFLQELRIVVLRRDVAVQYNVGVYIDEAGHQRRLRKVDRLDAGGRRASRRDRNDLVAFNDNDGVLNRGVALAINQPAGANGNAFRRRFLLAGLAKSRKTHSCKKNRRNEYGQHYSRIEFHDDLCPRRAQRVPQRRWMGVAASKRKSATEKTKGQPVSSPIGPLYLCSAVWVSQVQPACALVKQNRNIENVREVYLRQRLTVTLPLPKQGAAAGDRRGLRPS